MLLPVDAAGGTGGYYLPGTRYQVSLIFCPKTVHGHKAGSSGLIIIIMVTIILLLIFIILIVVINIIINYYDY